MRKNLPMLDSIQIANPCPANWDEMKGNDQVRHCSLCRLNVYNISEMTREDALELIHEHEGRLCIRMYKRSDGKVLTKDCPKGLAAVRKSVVKRLTLAVGFMLSLVGCRAFENWNTGVVAMPTTGKLAMPHAPKARKKPSSPVKKVVVPSVEMGKLKKMSK